MFSGMPGVVKDELYLFYVESEMLSEFYYLGMGVTNLFLGIMSLFYLHVLSSSQHQYVKTHYIIIDKKGKIFYNMSIFCNL